VVRHKEKDAEAGGEGLGKLQTRKKLWRDSTGAVVSKRRPEHEKKNRSSAATSKRLKAQDPFLECMNGLANQKDIPISPLESVHKHVLNRSGETGSAEIVCESSQSDEMWPAFSEDAALPGDDGAGVESYEFLCNASWGSQSQESTSPDILYDDFFAPDTGE
jgi:hypothetical protein